MLINSYPESDLSRDVNEIDWLLLIINKKVKCCWNRIKVNFYSNSFIVSKFSIADDLLLVYVIYCTTEIKKNKKKY